MGLLEHTKSPAYREHLTHNNASMKRNKITPMETQQ
jgi:hypothetical protein